MHIPNSELLPKKVVEELENHFQKLLEINDSILKKGIARPRNHSHLNFVPEEIRNLQLINYGTPGADNFYNGLNAGYTETKLIENLCQLFGDTKGETTGYITPGGSLSNLQAIYTARRNNKENSAFILSTAAHFSCDKSLDIVDFSDVRRVRTNEDDSICLTSLKDALRECTTEGIKSVNVVLTAGTTMKGGHDNIRAVLNLLDEFGYSKENRFVHVDGALTGLYLNLLEETDVLDESEELNLFDITPNFILDIDSICVSTHKFIGTQTSGSIFLCRRKKFMSRGRVSYVGIDDGTISGSRAADPCLQLFGLIITEHYCGYLHEMARNCLNKAKRIYEMMREAGVKADRCPYSIIVYFPKVPEYFRKTNYIVSDEKTSHFIAMPHVTDEMINNMIEKTKEMIESCGPRDVVREDGLIVEFLLK